MKILAVINQKGGVGKTTTAVNLGAALAEKGQRLLVVDLDPQANASSVLRQQAMGESPAPGLYGVLTGSVPIVDAVEPTRLENLWLLPSSLDLAGAEVEVARMDEHLLQLRRALEPLGQEGRFDMALLDCPPSLGILMTNALAAADDLLIPVQCEYYALEGLGLLLEVAGQICHGRINPKLGILGLLMTMHDARTNLNNAVVRDVRAHFEDVVFETVIPRTVRFGEAPSHGKTILEYDPAGAGAGAYRALAGEVLARIQAGKRFYIPAPGGTASAG